MQAKDIMNQNLPFIQKNDKLKDIVQLLKKSNQNLNVLPIIRNNKRPAGIINTNHIFTTYLKNNSGFIPISNIMNNNFTTIKENQEIEILKSFFQSKSQSKFVLVIDKNKHLQGIIGPEELTKYYFNHSQEIEEELNTILKSTRNGIIAINKEGKIIIYNQAATKIIGGKPKEALGQKAKNFLSQQGLLEVLETGQPQIGQKFKLGNKTIISNRTPLLKNDSIIGAVDVFQDISDLENIAQELEYTKKLNRELDTIIESVTNGLYITDGKGYTTRINSTYEKITGIKAEDVMGKHMEELVEEGYYSESVTLHVLQEKKPVTITHEIKTGKEVMITGTPVFDDDGNIIRVVTTVRDMETLTRMEQELKESKKLNDRYYNELEQLRLQQFKLDDVVIQSPKMKKVTDLAIRSGQFNSTVLISGESGTGKEVLARIIHESSQDDNKKGSLIKVNCGAIPDNLLESELFGYEKGAFTGAKEEGKPGLFELAEDGTLFLDEIGELPLKLQVKLLRALQEGEIIRVGGTENIKINTRIIAATNQNLEKLVKENKFRKDLYYRLNVIPLNVPPLRERAEDIGALLRHFLHQFNNKFNTNKKLSLKFIEYLKNYSWPGNVRQLKNIIERLIVMVPEDVITIDHLPGNLKKELSINKNKFKFDIHDSLDLKKARSQVEKEVIKNAMNLAETTREMASLLGISQPTVVRKIKKYNL